MTDELTLIDSRINQIVKLAHTGREADGLEYQRLQPELTALVERKTRGGAVVAAGQQAVVGEAPATSITQYPDLPQSDALDHIDRRMWNHFLPELLALKVTPGQARGLGQVLAKASAQAQAERYAEANQQAANGRQHAEEVLRSRYGSNWKGRLEQAERVLKNAMRHDPNAKIGNWTLSNGERLGDRPELVSMLVELAENRGR